MVAAGKFPFYMDFSLEVVGIEDAARAMILAADHGRVGERYIISDRFLSCKEIHQVAAQTGRVRPPLMTALPSIRESQAPKPSEDKRPDVHEPVGDKIDK